MCNITHEKQYRMKERYNVRATKLPKKLISPLWQKPQKYAWQEYLSVLP